MTHIILTGRLTADAQIIQKPFPFLQFVVAVNDKLIGRVDFFQVTYNRVKAAKWLTRATPVIVTGKVRVSEFERNGVKNVRYSVIAQQVELPARGLKEPDMYNPGEPPGEALLSSDMPDMELLSQGTRMNELIDLAQLDNETLFPHQ